MQLSHKPKWASRLMEKVELSDFFRHCPLSEKDKKEIRKCPKWWWGHEAEYEMEDIYFWIGGAPQTSTYFHYFGCIFQDVHL